MSKIRQLYIVETDLREDDFHVFRTLKEAHAKTQDDRAHDGLQQRHTIRKFVPVGSRKAERIVDRLHVCPEPRQLTGKDIWEADPGWSHSRPWEELHHNTLANYINCADALNRRLASPGAPSTDSKVPARTGAVVPTLLPRTITLRIEGPVHVVVDDGKRALVDSNIKTSLGELGIVHSQKRIQGPKKK